MSRIILNNISWNRPDGSNLFNSITFAFNSERIGLIGQNGAGKSLLARIMCGITQPASGNCYAEGRIGYFPQDLSIFSGQNVAEVLAVKEKMSAMNRITEGNATLEDFSLIDDDWTITERVSQALQQTGIPYLRLDRSFSSLSGGEKVRCVLGALLIASPDFLILDEPTNHLDEEMREFVYQFVQEWHSGLIVISHDRALLRLMDRVAELTPKGIQSYGGNYDFYIKQKEIEVTAAREVLQAAETQLKKRKADMDTTIRRQQMRETRAAKSASDDGLSKMAIHIRKGRGEKTLKKLTDIHQKRVQESKETLEDAKRKLPSSRALQIDVSDTGNPSEKKIIIAEEINYAPDGRTMLWTGGLSFILRGNERLRVAGKNGSGKSTLLKLISGQLSPTAGTLKIGAGKIMLLDQDVSLLRDSESVYENIQRHADGSLPEHELRIRLARFLFFKDDVFKPAGVLSGGERMRLGLACALAAEQAPELILLDEPTNNLDIGSITEVTAMLNAYHGALIVVSHDGDFIEEIGISRELPLSTQ